MKRFCGQGLPIAEEAASHNPSFNKKPFDGGDHLSQRELKASYHFLMAKTIHPKSRYFLSTTNDQIM
ncbi:hypothetical protein B6A27_11320 [Anoxybacillus sp. UARK-01]|nr:hypothetical protein B6A27_11320 [Anoxybacillus sp. UARK-01]